MKKKSLLVPYNSEGEIFIQDRTGHKLPPWGFFGGSIEEGESPLEAILRETKEELDIKLAESDIEFLALDVTNFDDILVERYFYLFRTEIKEFKVLEGAGGEWLSFEEADKRLLPQDKLMEVKGFIDNLIT